MFNLGDFDRGIREGFLCLPVWEFPYADDPFGFKIVNRIPKRGAADFNQGFTFTCRNQVGGPIFPVFLKKGKRAEIDNKAV